VQKSVNVVFAQVQKQQSNPPLHRKGKQTVTADDLAVTNPTGKSVRETSGEKGRENGMPVMPIKD
jgi:hypothetical protein